MPFVAISPQDASAYYADMPMWLAKNNLEGPALSRWVAGFLWSDTNITDGLNPTRNAVNGCPWEKTSAIGQVGSSTYSFILGYNQGVSFDVVVVKLLDFISTGSASTFSISVSDSGSISPGTFTEIRSEAWETNEKRKCFRTLWNNSLGEYRGARWIRLSWTNLLDAPDLSFLSAGNRIQFPQPPQRPYDPAPRISSFRAASSGLTKLTDYTRAQHRNIQFLTKTTPDERFGISGRDRARKVWTDSGYGGSTVVYWPQPFSSGDEALICSLRGEVDLTLKGPYHCAPIFNLYEQPEHLAAEVI